MRSYVPGHFQKRALGFANISIGSRLQGFATIILPSNPLFPVSYYQRPTRPREIPENRAAAAHTAA